MISQIRFQKNFGLRLFRFILSSFSAQPQLPLGLRGVLCGETFTRRDAEDAELRRVETETTKPLTVGGHAKIFIDSIPQKS